MSRLKGRLREGQQRNELNYKTYEKMGDHSADVGLYKTAIKYYQKMVSGSQKSQEEIKDWAEQGRPDPGQSLNQTRTLTLKHQANFPDDSEELDRRTRCAVFAES